jgi:hypothetical protein
MTSVYNFSSKAQKEMEALIILQSCELAKKEWDGPAAVGALSCSW